MNDQRYKKTINEICRFAEENDKKISRFSVVDILQMEYPDIEEPEIGQICQAVQSNGVQITEDSDENYSAEVVDPIDFYPANVNISQVNLTVATVMDRLCYDEFKLKPVYQRKGGLWSDEKQSRLIESLMLRIPLPAFYFDATKEGYWEVIDGQQRLTAFQNYLVGPKISEDDTTGEPVFGNKKAFEGMQYLREFNGKTFDQIPRQYVRRVKESNLIAYTVNRGTPEKIIYNIFQRINTGGVNLEPQEIRHSLYQGRSTVLIEKMANDPAFKEATQYAISPDRMLDREYALRYLAFTELDYEKLYKGNIDDFLILVMKEVNSENDEQEEKIFKEFQRVMGICHEVFGRYAFRRYAKMEKGYRRSPINKALFETWSICIKEASDEAVELLFLYKEDFIEKYCDFLADEKYSTSLKGGDESSLKRRIDLTKNFLREFVYAYKS